MSSHADLGCIQRWMQAVITDPDGAGAGLASAAARRHLPVDPEALEGVIAASSRMTAEQRLALYHRGYLLRVLECLRALHPALRHALGSELFDEFALDYVRARPSRSYTLHRLGEGFADHLADTRPDRHLPAGSREAWPDFLVDLARLERAFMEVYDGPGAEGERLIAAADLPSSPDARWLAAVAEPVPCVHLVRSRFPVGAYFRAVRRGEAPSLPAPVESFLALGRRDYVVTLTELDAPSYAALDHLLRGASVAASARAAALEHAAIWELVRAWADAGFLRSLVVEGRWEDASTDRPDTAAPRGAEIVR